MVALLRIGDHAPTSQMVTIMGAKGLILPILDSLSERDVDDADGQLSSAVAEGWLKSVIVTSRAGLPDGQAWEKFEQIATCPLKLNDVADYVSAYVPENKRKIVRERLESFLTDDSELSPLFLRFAIEQAMKQDITSTDAVQLVLQYVEELRDGKLDFNPDDMLRSACIVAIESIRESLAPREVSADYLRAALTSEADKEPFMNNDGSKKLSAAVVLDYLIQSGLVMRNKHNRNLQFVHDSVAEHLAAYWMATRKDDTRTKALQTRSDELQMPPMSKVLREAILEH